MVPTYTATIYVGLKDMKTGLMKLKGRVRALCLAYVKEMGLCVSMKSTEFIYSNGDLDGAHEEGVEVGLINYPRDPCTPKELEDMALRLASMLKVLCKQERVCVVFPDNTVMLS